jgi:hypothetical protein
MFHALARFSVRFRWEIVVIPSALSEQAGTIPVPEAPSDQTGPVGRKERP